MCGKTYFVANSQFQRSKYCSDKCFRKSKNKQVECKCEYCGKHFMRTKKLVVNSNKRNFCSPQCAKNFQKPKWEDIEAAFKERGYELLSTEYINAKSYLEYICPKHRDKGVQKIRYNNLKNGFGCKYCGYKRTANSSRGTWEQAKQIFAKNDMILLPQQYKNARTPMKYICAFHKEYGIQYKTLTDARVQHCPYCNVSHGQSIINKFLISHNIKFESQKKFDELRTGDDNRFLLSYDFFIQSYNLLIEYQGIQHYKPVERFGGQTQFQIQIQHDDMKRKYAESHGYKLLQIKYTEIKNIDNILCKELNLIA